MIHLGILGTGSIFAAQASALLGLRDDYTVSVLCDLVPEKLTHASELLSQGAGTGQVRTCIDFRELFEDPAVDAVLCATPPATHADIATEAMRHKKHVLLEKPASTEMNTLRQMYETADKENVLLHVAFHAAFAADLLWYLEHRDTITPNRLCSINCGFFDPYMADNKVIPAKHSLGGSWLDSGVNALSVCARLTDLSDFQLTDRIFSAEESAPHTVFSEKRVYGKGQQKLTITTGWDRGLNEKTTLLAFEDTNETVLLDHSNQCVVHSKDGVSRTLFKHAASARLVKHYTGVFADFSNAIRTGITNRTTSFDIHELLLLAV